MKPGDKVAGGTVVRVKDEGVYLGREATEEEAEKAAPEGHTEHRFGERKVYLSKDQGPIHPASDLCKPLKAAKEKASR